MAGLFPYSFYSQPKDDINFNGGLNSTSGPLSLKDTEASDLQNIDFNKFGSILKRNGYSVLTQASDVKFNDATATFGSAWATFQGYASGNNSFTCDGLWWYEYVSGGSYSSSLINISNGKAFSMPSLNGAYNDITGSATITPGNFFSFTNWANNVFMTDGEDPPLYWTGTGNVAKISALQANSYTFTVYSISVNPSVGDTYTNNGVTYTITFVNTSGVSGSIAGTIIMTGSGAPLTFGTLTRTTGSGDSTISFSLEVFNANITAAKYIAQWNNYLFLANVTISGVVLQTRIYWCNVRDFTTWSATSWIEISMQDGQPITGMYPLADRLVIFKERSIYNLFFTGDAQLPFVYLVSNSPTVGCVAPYSIQEVENGLVFLSYDGFYYYDSNNSYKMSLQIQNTINGLNLEQIQNAKSLKQRQKNRYMCCVTSSASNTNDTVIVWDWVLNAFSKYAGVYPSAMRTVYVGGYQEQLYFSDYNGYTYQMDNGVNDYPLAVETAISAYYWTNWKTFGDAMLQKANPNVVIYYESNNAVLTFGYSYDFDGGIDYQNTFSMAINASLWDTAIWDTATWTGSGGLYKRQDLAGRGRVVRFYFANSNMSEQMQIDGLASFINIQTNA